MMRMHLLLTGMALAVTGCYAPDVVDCTVTCTEPTDCADGQACTATGFCAAEGATCMGGGITVDAGTPALITLRVQIDGEGMVNVMGIGDCSRGMNNGVCTWQVQPRALRLQASPGPNRTFDKWTTMNCAGQSSTCMFTPSAATTVGVKFR
jgi:hypothetical protein